MPSGARSDTIDQRAVDVLGRWEFAVQWWQWIVVMLGVLVLLTAVAYGVQARRRRGGVIALKSRSVPPGRGGS